jgi:serine/threonine-protein phosphatase 2A regulatory subunit B''
MNSLYSSSVCVSSLFIEFLSDGNTKQFLQHSLNNIKSRRNAAHDSYSKETYNNSKDNSNLKVCIDEMDYKANSYMNSLLSPSSSNKKRKSLENNQLPPHSPHSPSTPNKTNLRTSSENILNSSLSNSGLLVNSRSSHDISYSIAPFYFPQGIPHSPNTKQRETNIIHQIFNRSYNNNKGDDDRNDLLGLSLDEFYPVTTVVCGLSSYCNSSLFARLLQLQYANDPQCNINAANEPNSSYTISAATFLQYWEVELEPYDSAQRFINVLKVNNKRNYLLREDFQLLLSEIVSRHQGLEFLDSTPEFQIKYAQTVIARIFYCVNKSGSERLILRELRESNFLTVLKSLDVEDDINKLHDYFSYEHFYVIYCKFWELDTDHDGLLNINDIELYEDYSLTNAILSRIMSGAGRKFLSGKSDCMNYLDFVIFLLSEVDKTTPQAIDYWFNCCDLDGDGVITAYEIELIFNEQKNRIQALSQELITLEDIICQLVDMVKSSDPNQLNSSATFTKKDLKRNPNMAAAFFNTLFNLNKFIQSEQKDVSRLLYNNSEAGPLLSDWDKFAITAYYRLADQEQNSNNEELNMNQQDS